MKKEEILEVAEKHFFAKRYSDVKLELIAYSLNIQKPTLYYYFKDKKDLFMQTLKFSYLKYLEQLKTIVEGAELDKFVDWYLIYPSENKNLFAISLQKGYCIDDAVNNIIFNGKITINKILFDFFRKYGLNDVKIFLIIKMLEKLASDNCIDGYCLPYNINQIKQELRKMILN